MIPQIDRSRLHAFFRVCLIQTCQTILSCIFADISIIGFDINLRPTPSLSTFKVHVHENFSKFIFIYSLFFHSFYVLYSTLLHFSCPPHKSLCRRMLDLNPGMLRLWHCKSHEPTSRRNLIHRRIVPFLS